MTRSGNELYNLVQFAGQSSRIDFSKDRVKIKALVNRV
jgi:hypothetical protein